MYTIAHVDRRKLRCAPFAPRKESVVGGSDPTTEKLHQNRTRKPMRTFHRLMRLSPFCSTGALNES